MRAFIGLGSNLADPEAQIRLAVAALKILPESQFIQASSLYMSPPMGPQDQPDYINAVIELETSLSAHKLLDKLQAIEQQQGRERNRRWGERTLDLDLLAYGDQCITDERLQIPHPGIAVRAVVLYPLAEIAEDLILPKLGAVNDLLKQCPLDGLKRVKTL